jgi:hypothetical protein
MLLPGRNLNILSFISYMNKSLEFLKTKTSTNKVCDPMNIPSLLDPKTIQDYPLQWTVAIKKSQPRNFSCRNMRKEKSGVVNIYIQYVDARTSKIAFLFSQSQNCEKK